MKSAKPTIVSLEEARKYAAKPNEVVLLFVERGQVAETLSSVKVRRGAPPPGPGLDLIPLSNGDYVGIPVCPPDQRPVVRNGCVTCVPTEFNGDMPDDQIPEPQGCRWVISPLARIVTCEGECEGGSPCRTSWYFGANGLASRCYCAVLMRRERARAVPQ